MVQELICRWITGVLIFCLYGTVVVVPGTAFAQLVIAHRGASYRWPENTLIAFQHAWKEGADGIEGDFYLTADGKIVCIHDKDTRRTAGELRIVEESTLPELRQLEYGAWKSPEFHGEPIPTFEDVYNVLRPGKLFVVELKSDTRIVEPLSREFARLGVNAEQILIISFHSDVIRKCKKLLPGIRCHWLTGFKEESYGWRPTVDQIVAMVRACKADGVGLQGNPEVITADFVRQLRGRGVDEFHVWTVDDPDTAGYFKNLGAVAITTNRPAVIRQALSR